MKRPSKSANSAFDRLVARYYPAVYSFASRLTDDPRQAIALARNVFTSVRPQLRNTRDESAIASKLFAAVLHAGLAAY